MQFELLHEDLVSLFEGSVARFGNRPLLGVKKGGAWRWHHYSDIAALVDSCRAGLAALGVGAGDHVAIASGNSLEWAVACYATFGLGAAFVPLYEIQALREWQFILNDCGARVVVASTRAIYDRLIGLKPELPALERVIGVDLPADHPDAFSRLLQAGANRPVPAVHPRGSALAVIIYTSGTTGLPKGVRLSHGNITSTVYATLAIHENLGPDDRSLAFLPWAHSYGQVVELHAGVCLGSSAAINDDLASLVTNLGEIRPTILLAVPRVFNSAYDAIQERMAGQPTFVRTLFQRGLRHAKARQAGQAPGFKARVELAAADRLVFRKIRATFGGRLKLANSASASLSPAVAEFFHAIGVPVYEGYGLTETGPTVTGSSAAAWRVGAVGKPVPGVRVEIDTSRGDGRPGHGEIVVYGPNVMLGYHRRPEENARVLTPDGGLRTSDIGCFDQDGYLYVTGRIKEQYKLENGKYVAPAPLEEQLRLSPYILNAVLYGANRPYNVALVVIDRAAVDAWAAARWLPITEPTRDERVRTLIRDEIERSSRSFRGYEKIRDFVLTCDDFSIEDGTLTPTLKLKRSAVLARFEPSLRALYRAVPAPIGA